MTDQETQELAALINTATASKAKKTRITRAQVVTEAKGWVTWTTKDGEERKSRKGALVIVDPSGPKMRRIGEKTHRVSVAHYQKVVANSGHTSLDCGDAIAQRLRGMALDDLYAEAAKVLAEDEKALRARYAKLNPGMQRMNLGNRMRAA